MKNNITYANSGVDISAGEDLVKKIVPMVRETHSEKVLSDIGLFGGFYDGRFPEMAEPVLVASTDGVGTKLKVAFMTGIHNTVGQCLVNHCVNDILCCGAKPLFFLDYFATGKLKPDVAADVISGFCKAAKENNCALIGGETAEMPSMYNEGEYDVSGTIVGVVDKDKIVNGKNIQSGDAMIGLKSSGLHTNGYSLARNVLFPKYSVTDTPAGLDATIGEALLAVHKSYLHEVLPLVEEKILTGISHITGGGIVGNTKRVVAAPLEMDIYWDRWEVPAIFKLIQEEGNIDEEEMKKAFNMGIGMILICRPENVSKVLDATKTHNPLIIGEIK